MKCFKFRNKMSFRLWIWFSLFSIGLTILFWFLLVSSIKINYREELITNLKNVSWSISEKYGEDDFENNIRFITKSDDYFVQIISENNNTIIKSIDNQGEDSDLQQEDIIDKDLFEELDHTNGFYTYYVADTVHNSKWVVYAMVIANWDSSREVMIISKSMANVDVLINLLTSRILIVMLFLLILSLIISGILAKTFTKPIGILTDKAKLLADGNYDISFPKTGPHEIRQLSDTLEIATNEFNSTEQLRRDFLANISHDMKTPLTVIKVYAEMIQTVSGDNPNKRNTHIETILNEADKLTNFINDSMELARLQSKTISVSFEIFNLNDIVIETMNRYQHFEELDGYHFTIDLCNEAFIYADRKLIGRALCNLISNSIKFSIDRKEICIQTTNQNNEILFKVIDSGIGIDKENIKLIWERFYQVGPYDGNKTGMGIGLNIVKEIFTLHHAKYGVQSKPGEGSCFWFALQSIEG